MDINKVSVKIAGPAGEGVISAGEIFAKCCSRGGLYVVTENERPSLIRGGHNQFMIRAEADPIYSYITLVNVLVALDKNSVDIHKNEMSYKGAIIYNSEAFTLSLEELGRDDLQLIGIPMNKWVQEFGVGKIIENAIGLGAAIGVLDYELSILTKLLREMYAKHPEALDADVKSATRAYEFVRENFSNFTNKLEVIKSAPKRMLINGITALDLAAVKCGVSFVSQYPMTPSTGVIQGLAKVAEDYGIVVVQTEDEIASINMAIGASHAGIRAITATSGGGYALMNEGLSLAGATETPIVIVMVQRGNPGTGLPTRTEQSDLLFVLNSGHGDFPHVVIAPSDPSSCYTETQRAFNLAEKYQVPVTLLLDRHNAETFHCLEKLPEDLPIERGEVWTQEEVNALHGQKPNRFEWNDATGVSKRVLPGLQNAGYVASSNEHEPSGLITEDRGMRTRMMQKRQRKLETLKQELPKPQLDGNPHADVTFITWGSTLLPIKDARAFLTEQGKSTAHLHLTYMNPFQEREVREILENVRNPVIVENNLTSQLGQLIQMRTGIAINKKILQYDGWPFAPEDIARRVVNEEWS